jgi:ABC-type glycerol-3-phosphate transport system substrate-binding protein
VGWAVGVKCSKAIARSEITRGFRVSENLLVKERRREIMKRVIVSVVILSLVFGSLFIPAVVPAQQQELEGEIYINIMGTDTKSWEAVANAYMKLHPKVKVRVELKPPEGYPEWLRAQFAAGEPKASLVNANVVNDLIQAKKFLDFSIYMDKISPYSKRPWKEDFDPVVALAVRDPLTGEFYTFSPFLVQVTWFYNKGIFANTGIKPPNNWDELVAISKKLKAKGYIPWAVEGDYRSFWEMRIGWIARIYADQYTRKEAEIVRAQPGDYCFRPGIDDKWKPNYNDPHNDDPTQVTFNILRKLRAVRDGILRVDSPEWRDQYINFKKMIPEYVPSGFTGVTNAYPLFLTQKAAMWLDGTWMISTFEKDLASLAATEKTTLKPFSYGIFPMPTMTGPLVQAPIRTIEWPVGFWSIPKKSKKQNDLEMDFLMFLTSPQGFSIYLKSALNPANPKGGIGGIPLIRDIEVPPTIKKRFSQVKVLGNMEKDTAGTFRARGLMDYQPSVQEWVDLAQKYFMGKLSIDEFLKQYQASIQKHLPGVLDMLGLTMEDLDHPEKKPPERKR